MNVFIPE